MKNEMDDIGSEILIAIGRTSRVIAHDRGVAKVLNPGVPDHWAAVEATFTEAVRGLGLPAPEVIEVTAIGGRPAIVYERVSGVSMWDEMLAHPSRVPELVAEFSRVQRVIHAAGPPPCVPSLIDRMDRKIADVDVLDDDARTATRSMLAATPRGAALLHGDLHPGNVLMSESGLVVIDWFDAAVGHPVADVVRTALLLQAVGATDLQHLPGAHRAVVESVYESYVDAMTDVLAPPRGIDDGATDPPLAEWEAVVAASRLAERTDDDIAGLLELWRSARAGEPTTLARALSAR